MAAVLFVVGLCATFVGQIAVNRALKATGRPSIVIFSIGIVVALSAFFMGIQSIGHLMSATIFTTAEIVLGDVAGHRFARSYDPVTGFPELEVVRDRPLPWRPAAAGVFLVALGLALTWADALRGTRPSPPLAAAAAAAAPPPSRRRWCRHQPKH